MPSSPSQKVLEQNKKQVKDIVRSVDRECYYNREELMGSECNEIHPANAIVNDRKCRLTRRIHVVDSDLDRNLVVISLTMKMHR